jgi:dienelactone hydrolase
MSDCTPDDEPLGLWLGPCAPGDSGGLRLRDLEFSSRGDRVTGRLILPAQRGSHPVVLVQHAFGDSAAGVLDALGASWVQAGAAIAAIDFPLHGARADQKLLRRLADGRDAALATEFAHQAVIDLGRALDALAAIDELDAKRIAYVGFGLGAQIGGLFCALDPRPAAVVLAPAVGAALPAGPDPAPHLDRIAPRPLLRVEDPPGVAAAAIWGFLTRIL